MHGDGAMSCTYITMSDLDKATENIESRFAILLL